MSAKHALLGLLLQRDAYPYELADRLQARLGPAWAINSGQLYQTIGKLEQDGLIELVGDGPGSRTERRVFSITERGTAEFERWFAGSTSGARLTRRPLLVKLTLAGPERLDEALKQIAAYERDCAEKLKQLSKMVDEVPADGPQVRADHVLLRLGLSADIFQIEGELRWARHAHEMVSWLRNREALWPSAHERSDARSDTARKRRDARENLFSRMAARNPRPLPVRKGTGTSGGQSGTGSEEGDDPST
jgi:DNA-binding PadR family transcriptional regulator